MKSAWAVVRGRVVRGRRRVVVRRGRKGNMVGVMGLVVVVIRGGVGGCELNL